MTVTEYLIELEEQLKFLPKKKRASIMLVYREKINNMIDYGEDEEKITAIASLASGDTNQSALDFAKSLLLSK